MEEYNYAGRIADRQTEDDYTTQNLMTVSQLCSSLTFLFSMIKNLQIKLLFMLREELEVMAAFHFKEKIMAVKFRMEEVAAKEAMFILELLIDFRICMS